MKGDNVRLVILHAVCSALVLTCVQAHAHQGELLFPIYELPTADLPDLHDGTLQDWEDALPGASVDQNLFERSGGGTAAPDDISFRIFLAWHNSTNRIYVAVERIDDVYIAEGDGVGFMIDGDHSGGAYNFPGDNDADRLAHHSQAQLYYALPEPQAPTNERMFEAGPADAWVSKPPWSEVGGFQISEAPSYSLNEFFITPWDQLTWTGPDESRRTSLIAGQVIGFNVYLVDIDVPFRDDSAPIQGLYYLTIPKVRPTTAHGFADGELIPCSHLDCSRSPETAVRQDTWGRIKASVFYDVPASN